MFLVSAQFGSRFYSKCQIFAQFAILLSLYFFVPDIQQPGPCDINRSRLPDGHTSGIKPQSIQESLHMPEFRKFTASQLLVFRDHKSESRSYNTVSMFGMRPPELVGVFEQTKSYIQLCYTDWKSIPDDIHQSLLSLDIHKCHWVSLLSLYIRINAIDEVEQLVDSNLTYLNSNNNMNGSRTSCYCCSNKFIKYLICNYKADSTILNEVDLQFKQECSNDFFYNDDLLMSPIPVLMNIHPKNSQIFFIHFLLTHGRYVTEIDVLHHSSPRQMLESAQLIDRNTDHQSLHDYSTKLIRVY